MEDAPEVMFNEDGYPMAVRGDLATNAQSAFRYIAEEFDFFIDHFDCVAIGDEDEDGNIKYRPRLSTYRHQINEIKLSAMRPWREGDDEWTEWGDEAWYWCPWEDPKAVPYWEVRP